LTGREASDVAIRPEAGRPVEAGAGQQPNLAALDPGRGPVPIEFNFVEPTNAFGWLVDESCKFRRDEFRELGSRRVIQAAGHSESA
jgi:hypothetical protein